MDAVYTIHRSVDIGFAHHVRGHSGACVNLHGHTWKFEVGLSARALDKEGFVVDFSRLKREVLEPVHALLDHSLAIGEATLQETLGDLESLGKTLVGSRLAVHGTLDTHVMTSVEGDLGGARNHFAGGMKLAVFGEAPTSERFAEWLFRLSEERLSDQRVSVAWTRVYESLHPVESVAEFRLLPDRR